MESVELGLAKLAEIRECVDSIAVDGAKFFDKGTPIPYSTFSAPIAGPCLLSLRSLTSLMFPCLAVSYVKETRLRVSEHERRYKI